MMTLAWALRKEIGRTDSLAAHFLKAQAACAVVIFVVAGNHTFGHEDGTIRLAHRVQAHWRVRLARPGVENGIRIHVVIKSVVIWFS